MAKRTLVAFAGMIAPFLVFPDLIQRISALLYVEWYVSAGLVLAGFYAWKKKIVDKILD